eukprot:g56817.t1
MDIIYILLNITTEAGIAPDPATYNYTEEHCGNNATFWLTIADCCGGENSTKCDYIPVMDYTPTSNETEMDPPTNETSSPSVTASICYRLHFCIAHLFCSCKCISLSKPVKERRLQRCMHDVG